MNTHLEDIVKLQDALAELADAEVQLHQIPSWMQELHAEHESRLSEIQNLEAAAESAQVERRAAETALAEAQEKLKRYQQQIHQVTNQREYGALLAEIDTAKTKIAQAEEQGQAAEERREQAEKQLAEEQEAFASLRTRYSEELARWESEKPQISDRVSGLRQAIQDLRDRLPRGPLSVFDRVRQRYNGAGVAAIVQIERVGKGPKVWACSACSYSVRPQVVVQVRSTSDLLQCDGCKRILYLPPAPAPLVEVEAEA